MVAQISQNVARQAIGIHVVVPIRRAQPSVILPDWISRATDAMTASVPWAPSSRVTT